MIVFLSLILGFLAGPETAASGVDKQKLAKAFAIAHDGYSVDEVLIRDDLRKAFLSQTQQLGIESNETDTLLALLKLRKSGQLGVRSSRRGRPADETVIPAAEIASRVVTDRHRVSIDSVLASPDLRDELQTEAEHLLPDVKPYDIRKAALQLRKRRALRPELVLRVADWDRKIETCSLSELKTRLSADQIPHVPGIYLFRHSTEGYLYVGEARDIDQRLNQHVAASDRVALAEFLSGADESTISVEMHLFPSDSPAKNTSVRRAYESELIRSREPKFNVRP